MSHIASLISAFLLFILSNIYANAQVLTSDFNFIGTSFGIPGQNATFEYVVIGGGTAGLAIATRLAQAKYTVAVIEAGGFFEIGNGNLSTIPADIAFWSGSSPEDYNPLADWGFVTTPQAGLNGRRIHYARGKGFGGSSARNYMAYQRSTNESYDRWASEVDDSTYRFASFAPFFDKSVQLHQADIATRTPNATVPTFPMPQVHGPVQVSYSRWTNAFSSWVKLSLSSLGFKEIRDFISGGLLGMQYAMVTEDPTQETRSSSETAYMRIAINQKLPIAFYTQALAKRILFTENASASGVLVQTGRKIFELKATKEVILSSGAFQSPQMLMVSGIGPKETLEQYNIPCIADRPGVGQNLWDHVLFGPSYTVDVQTHSAVTSNITYAALVTEEYIKNASGPLTNPGADFIAWETLPEPQRRNLTNNTLTALSTFPSDWPEIEYLFLDSYAGNNENYVLNAPKDERQYESPSAALVAPLSRGNVTISSDDMSDPPVINPNLLTHPADRDVAVQAWWRMKEIMNTPAIQPIIGQEVYPGPDKIHTDQDVLDFIGQTAITVFHAAATCKMGKTSDPLAVVDSQCRVYGANRLRVVDISAFPFLPPGHPQGNVYALAEKIASHIVSNVY